MKGVVIEWMLTGKDVGARLLNRNRKCTVLRSLARGEVNPAGD
jgi:hypothetical protein